MEIGTRTVLKEGVAGLSHHLLAHARRRDLGTVVESDAATARSPRWFVLVVFDCCAVRHRLLADELERPERV